jgi:hypothetical protein
MRLSNATISANRTAMSNYECGCGNFFHLVSLSDPRMFSIKCRTMLMTYVELLLIHHFWTYHGPSQTEASDMASKSTGTSTRYPVEPSFRNVIVILEHICDNCSKWVL